MKKGAHQLDLYLLLANGVVCLIQSDVNILNNSFLLIFLFLFYQVSWSGLVKHVFSGKDEDSRNPQLFPQ